MRRRDLALITLAITGALPAAASAVSTERLWIANFARGTQGTPSYQRMSFVLLGSRPTVELVGGRRQAKATLQQLPSPPGRLNLRLPNGVRIRMSAGGTGIRVWRRDTHTVTTLRWTDDSPILGSPPACTVCVSRSASRAFLERYFLNGRG